MAGPGSELMTKVAQSQIHPAAGAIYYTIINQTFVGNGVAYILPFHEVYAIAFSTFGDKFTTIEMTIDDPAMIEAETANWETWNEVDLISLAITGVRMVRDWAFSATSFTATVKTRP